MTMNLNSVTLRATSQSKEVTQSCYSALALSEWYKGRNKTCPTDNGRMLTLVLRTEEWGKLSVLAHAGSLFSSRAHKQDQWKMKRISAHRSWRTSSTVATDQAWVSQLKEQYWPFSLVSSGRPFQDDLRQKTWMIQTQITFCRSNCMFNTI